MLSGAGSPISEKGIINGFLFEGLYCNEDGVRSAEETAELLNRLKPIGKSMAVYIVDFPDPDDSALILDTQKNIQSHKFIPFLTTPDFQGRFLNS